MRKGWTAEEDDFLRKHYADSTPEELEAHLERSRPSIYQHATALGLKKSEQYFKTVGAGRFPSGINMGHRFAKGFTPWNKGLAGWVAKGTEATRFKPGNRPPQELPIGSLRISKDGLLQRKISNDAGSNSQRWRSVHELVWVEVHGPVPPGHIVIFKPGMKTIDPEQITLDKVECISRAENARRNHQRLGADLIRLYQIKGAITRQVNRINREQKA